MTVGYYFFYFFLSQPLLGMTGPLVGLRGDKVQHVEAPLEVKLMMHVSVSSWRITVGYENYGKLMVQ